jgi:hypothetical protein
MLFPFVDLCCCHLLLFISGDYPVITIMNWMLDTTINSDEYILSYEVITNGVATAEKEISYSPIAVQQTGNITVPNIVVNSADEVYFNLIFRYAKDNIYAKKGDIFAHEQFELNGGKLPVPKIDNTSSLSIDSSNSAYYEIKGKNPSTSKDFVVRIGKASGMLSYYAIGKKVLINSSIVPNFWRV